VLFSIWINKHKQIPLKYNILTGGTIQNNTIWIDKHKKIPLKYNIPTGGENTK
jgi:hypothetical protein